MIRLIKYRLNKRKEHKASLKQLQRKIELIERRLDGYEYNIHYYQQSMIALAKRLERVEHSTMPTYSMKRMMRDKELNQ